MSSKKPVTSSEMYHFRIIGLALTLGLLASCDSVDVVEAPEPDEVKTETLIYFTVYFDDGVARIAEAPFDDIHSFRYITPDSTRHERPLASPDGTYLLVAVQVSHGFNAFVLKTVDAARIPGLGFPADPYTSLWSGSEGIFRSSFGLGIGGTERHFGFVDLGTKTEEYRVEGFTILSEAGDSLIVFGREGDPKGHPYLMSGDGSWKQYLSNQFLSDVPGGLRRILSATYDEGLDQLAFHYQDPDGYHIAITDLAGSFLKILSTTPTVLHPVWGPDGSVLWTSYHDPPTTPRTKSIRIWRNGGVETLLFPGEIPGAIGVEIGSIITLRRD